MADQWMTVREAMEELRVSRSRVYSLKDSGEIRSEKSGNILKLNAQDVRDYADREKKPGWPRGQPRSVSDAG